MKSSLTKNYIYNLSYQLLVLIVPLVTMPYISRVLGDYNVGVFNFIQAVVGYFVLFGCIGLNLYGQREIAACGGDLAQRSRVFWELQSIRTLTVGAAFLLYTVCVTLIVREIRLYYYLFSIEILASILDISWFFQGIERFKVQTVRNFVVKMAGVACIFLFVRTKEDLAVYIGCYAATIFLGNVLLWFCLRGELLRVSPGELKPSRHLRAALIVFLPQIATSVYAQLDKTMIKLLSDFNQVAYYSQAEKIVKIVLTVVTAMGLVMLSRVAVSYSQSDKEMVRHYIHQSFRYLCFLMWPCMFGCMVIARDFVPWYLGAGYEQTAPCMIVLSPIIVLIGISNTLGTQYLLPTNQMKYYTTSVVVGAVVNAVFNLLLIPSFGCIGASVATVIAELAVAAVQFWCLRDTFSPKILLKGYKNFLAAAVMGAVVWLFSRFAEAGIGTTFAEIAIGVVVYLVLLWVMRDDFFRELLRRVFRRGKTSEAQG